jgi:1,4-alpha-glucan branching enzyme
MKTDTMVEYAVQRTREHLLNFQDMYRMLRDGTSNVQYVADLENRDNIFPNINFRVFADPC